MAGAALKTALERDTSEQAVRLRETAAEDLALALGQMIMEQADPTANKRFTLWLMREYAAGRLILEDLGSANDTLTLFQRYASRLKTEQRDIQRYDNLADAWQSVQEFAERDEAQSNRAQKALDRAQAYAESRILRQDPDGFTVAVPLTEFAAKWWGKGTRWCTAAENNNQFDYYHGRAPLIVILVPKVGKFQIWVADKEFQFMDAANKEPDIDVIAKNWSYFKTLLPSLLHENGLLLRLIPKMFQTKQLCWIAVKTNGAALEHVPAEFTNEELCLTAVRDDGFAIMHVPRPLQIVSVCCAAVAQNGYAISYVPEEHRVEEMWALAVARNGGALWDAPLDLRTDRVCRLAVAQNGLSVIHVPEFRQTPEIYRLAVEQDGLALGNIPKHLRSEMLCHLALSQTGRALLHVPEEIQNSDIYHMAVTKDGWALQYVPERYVTEELCRAAVTQCGVALTWVPFALRTEEICRIAVQENSWSLRDVPSHLLSLMPISEPDRSSEEHRLAAPFWPLGFLERLEQTLMSHETNLTP